MRCLLGPRRQAQSRVCTFWETQDTGLGTREDFGQAVPRGWCNCAVQRKTPRHELGSDGSGRQCHRSPRVRAPVVLQRPIGSGHIEVRPLSGGDCTAGGSKDRRCRVFTSAGGERKYAEFLRGDVALLWSPLREEDGAKRPSSLSKAWQQPRLSMLHTPCSGADGGLGCSRCLASVLLQFLWWRCPLRCTPLAEPTGAPLTWPIFLLSEG